MEEIGDVPEVVGSYRTLGVIGVGGMGAVIRAEHTLLGRTAAIKVLRPDSSRNHETVNRFFNEAKAAAAVRHPGIVEIYDFGYLPSGAAFLVMELLEGETLRARLRARGRLTEREAFGIVRGIASALAAAHARGIIHRDIKPDNIFLVPDAEEPNRERVKLLDFGIAKLSPDSGFEGGNTGSGVVLGTPTYMAPEQCKGAGKVDHRADLYSVGCVLMQLLTGASPFHGMGIGETIGAHVYVPPPTLRSRVPDSSDAAEELVAHLLAKDPDDRVQTAVELLELAADASGSSSSIITGSTWQPPLGDERPITTMRRGSLATDVALPGPRGRRWWPLAAGAAAVGAAMAGIVLGLIQRAPSKPSTASPIITEVQVEGGTAIRAPIDSTDAAGGAPLLDAGMPETTDHEDIRDAGVARVQATDERDPEIIRKAAAEQQRHRRRPGPPLPPLPVLK
jgi:serine/threonine-protein kinase